MNTNVPLKNCAGKEWVLVDRCPGIIFLHVHAVHCASSCTVPLQIYLEVYSQSALKGSCLVKTVCSLPFGFQRIHIPALPAWMWHCCGGGSPCWQILLLIVALPPAVQLSKILGQAWIPDGWSILQVRSYQAEIRKFSASPGTGPKVSSEEP